MSRLGFLCAVVAGLGLAFFSGPRAHGAGLTLIEPGGGPHKVLRYHPKPGLRERSTLTLRMQVEGKGAGLPKLPGMSAQIDWRLLGVSGEDLVVGMEQTIDTTAVAAAAKTPPVHMKLRETMTTRGELRDFQVESVKGLEALPPGFMDQLRQNLKQVSAPWLPKQAVGVGARWLVRQDLSMFGLRLTGDTVYELTELAGDRLHVKFRATFSATGSRMELPGMPPDVKIEVGSVSGEGTGTMTVDLTRLAPVSSTVEMRMRMAMRVRAGGRDEAIDMQMSMSLGMETPAAAPPKVEGEGK